MTKWSKSSALPVFESRERVNKMNIENFAVLVRHEGVTKQILMTAGEQQLFSRIVLGTLADTHGKVAAATIESIELPANEKAFPTTKGEGE